MRRRHLMVAAGLAGIIGVLAVGQSRVQAAVNASAVDAPQFEVDPLWPKPLPNHWLLGQTIGVSADAQDHIWIIHRAGSLEPGELHADAKPPIAQCCSAAPPVLSFDQEGNLVAHWGGPGEGFDWPNSNHGITIDYKGNVWIGGNGRGPQPTGQPVANAANGANNEGQIAGVQGYFNDSMILKF